MRCPFCDADKDSLKVIDSRTCEGGRAVRRRRQCLKCDKRFTTYERIEEQTRLIVVKRDGRRIPWDRGKILSGLERACFKRPVPQAELQRIVDEVEEELFRTHDREVPSSAIGETVIERLRSVDKVAYVRFASVYRQFATLEELINEARTLLEQRRYETPGQGELFAEEVKKAPAGKARDAKRPPAGGTAARQAGRRRALTASGKAGASGQGH
jgi:transcriptional repressor NrdR